MQIALIKNTMPATQLFNAKLLKLFIEFVQNWLLV